MITNPEGTRLISYMGWVDHDSLWVFDTLAQSVIQIQLGSAARYVSLHSSGMDYFAVQHHHSGSQFEVTVRTFTEPTQPLARAVLTRTVNQLSGDLAVWSHVPHLYVAHLAFAPWQASVLLTVMPETGSIEAQHLRWYDEFYDKGYQGILDVLELPEKNVALISVSRSSEVIIHDRATGYRKATVKLAGRMGNPAFYFRRSANEIWASDYDALVIIDSKRLEASRTVLVQAAEPGTQAFIGNYFFSWDEQTCVIARPFSGDVVSIDPSTLGLTGRARLGSQPLDVAVLKNGQVVARDWKTGNPLYGHLEPIVDNAVAPLIKPVPLFRTSLEPVLPHTNSPLTRLPPEWITIPAGPVTLENNHGRFEIASFSIAKYPVTNAQFQLFVDESEGYINETWWEFSPAALTWHQTHQWAMPRFEGHTQPRARISWFEAMAFCHWLGHKTGLSVTLPTEIQWQRAAQGYRGSKYPYGQDFDPTKSNTSESRLRMTTPVDHYSDGQSRYGVFDMVGNIWEWCLNRYNNPQNSNPTGDKKRSVRGGSWHYDQSYAHIGYRYNFDPGYREDDLGFRVAVSVRETENPS